MADSNFTFTSQVRPICEIGVASIRESEPHEWVDVSCNVHEAELFRGRERFNERFEPGTASVTFQNADGWADLGGTYAEVADAVLRPGRHIRIGVLGPWTPGLSPFIRWLFRGFIDQATPTYDPVIHDTVTINCIDALGEAGSSVAPTAEHQGVNETVSARLNRVLDAVGWWSAKRKIDTSTTTVQGTQLGGLGVDHMGQAADSAGGVVFGDLDGDVVFKDIDWMLYDPDVPPDGTIGPGDPGAPGGDTPPYIDPSPGPVYDPDDPPATNPPKICACAEDGDEGTLIEKGDNYRLFVKDGHLWYESSGHLWDMGPYDGGCTCVDPNGGDGEPERTDDGVISPFDPIEMPPPFGVELLAWNDGGLADPPASSITVAGITPGHDCVLAVLINALGSVGNVAGLAPVVTGGGLDWAHRRDEDQAGDGASSFIVLAPVGRTDPGTFDVTATWQLPSTSRSHIITVWKISSAVNDYVERFDAGVVLYALTDSNPPDEAEPGNGGQIVEQETDQQPVGVEQVSRNVDITIAQTLAEEDTEPFGAILEDGWVIPFNVPALTEPAPFIDTSWSDDFERTDGPLGDDWKLGEPLNYYMQAYPMEIDSGEAIGTTAVEESGISPLVNTMRWVEPQGANQMIEAVMDNVWPNGELQLYLHGNDDNDACHVGYFFFSQPATGPTVVSVSVFHHDADWTGDRETASVVHTATHPITCRFEADSDGTLRAYVDGTLAVIWTDPVPLNGPMVGFGFEFGGADPGGGLIVGSPRVISINGASIGDVRKTSWTAGWKLGPVSSVVFDDVNTGPSDIQSSQAILTVESAEVTSGFRLLGYDLRADTDTVTAAGTMTFTNPPRPGAFIAVMVGVTHTSDVIDAVSVTGGDFTRAHVQHKSGSSWGQGAIFTATAPADMPDAWAINVSYPGIESISAVVYEITDQDLAAPIGGLGSGVLGDSSAGSVNGASTITLSSADAASTVLAYIHVAAAPSTSSGAATGSSDWNTVHQHSPATQRGYMQTMARDHGTASSTSTAVPWGDVQTGTATTYSGVQLAIEVRPNPDFGIHSGPQGVWLGGINDPWNGTIGSAGAYNPDGSPIWEFP